MKCGGRRPGVVIARAQEGCGVAAGCARVALEAFGPEEEGRDGRALGVWGRLPRSC